MWPAPARSLALLLFVSVAGCSSQDLEPLTSAPPQRDEAMTVAVAGPAGMDPLRASSRAAQFVMRQVYEPLVAELDPPYGRAGRRKGLALGLRAGEGGRVWIARLRPGVRFSDGSALNADAVAANARRWALDAPELLSGLETADAPRPDRARFIFSTPVGDLPARLRDPRLGIVSLAALRERGGTGFRFVARSAAGSGAYTVERRGGGLVRLVRNPTWWGSALRLGPAVRRIDFVVERDPAERLALLEDGRIRIADELGKLSSGDRGRLRRDPLLDAVRARDSLLGVERSIRGIDLRAAGTPLSGIWSTATNQAPPG